MQRLSGFQNGLIAVYARIFAAANTRQRVRWRRVVGTTNLRSQGGLRRCVAFQTHPAHATKEESVEQPWGGAVR